MSCPIYKYQGTGACKDIQPISSIKAIEVIFMTNKEVEIKAIAKDDSKRPITNGNVSLVIDGKDYFFERTNNGTYKSNKELF